MQRLCDISAADEDSWKELVGDPAKYPIPPNRINKSTGLDVERTDDEGEADMSERRALGEATPIAAGGEKTAQALGTVRDMIAMEPVASGGAAASFPSWMLQDLDVMDGHLDLDNKDDGR